MSLLQRSTSRTLHLRSRDPAGETVSRSIAYARPAARPGVNTVARGGAPVVIHRESQQQASATSSPAVPVQSDALLKGNKVVQIVHNGEAYQLRATRHGKLILTK
jgi:hemin uptake protein HemP